MLQFETKNSGRAWHVIPAQEELNITIDHNDFDSSFRRSSFDNQSRLYILIVIKQITFWSKPCFKDSSIPLSADLTSRKATLSVPTFLVSFDF